MTYLGRRLCAEHWRLFANEDSAMMEQLADAIHDDMMNGDGTNQPNGILRTAD